MLLFAAKTSGKGHVVGEKIEYFYEETTDLVSANVIPLVHRLGLLCCASALPNHRFSKLLNTAINIAVDTRHGGRISWPLRQSQHGGVDVETLKERAPVTGKIPIRLRTKHCKIVDKSSFSCPWYF